MLVLSWCWVPVQQLAGIVYPWRGDAEEPARLLRWFLHVLLWTSVLAGLWYLNRWGSFERRLRSPWPMLHRTWLPLLALSVYGLGWLGRGLWLSLAREPLPRLWPAIDAAWNETRCALEKANIDLRTTPLFLILGPLTSDLQTLLASLGTSPLSHRANVPFHVFARADAIFVVCDDLSQLGLQANPRHRDAADRLRYLCQLAAHDRGLKLPIQGILLIVPFGANAVKEAQADLRTVRQATGIEVPVHVAVSGGGVNADSGWFQQFPPMPDLDPAEVRTMFQEGVDWLCLERIATDVHSQFRLDFATAEPGKLSQGLRENIRLYQSLCAVQAWRTRLKQLLIEGTQNDYSESGMVAGCYFLSSSESKTLASALWADLLAYQNSATWTADTIALRDAQRRRTWQGYALGGAAIAVASGFLLWRL